jgi:hypothetical protein
MLKAWRCLIVVMYVDFPIGRIYIRQHAVRYLPCEMGEDGAVLYPCESCKNHDDDDTCKLSSITISDRELTAAGFLPQCQEYEEMESE